MSFGRLLKEQGRRGAACLAIALAGLAATAGAAGAETTFGGNPDQEAEPEIASEVSCAPFTCTLFWSGAVAGDLAPIGPAGGSGTVTSITLPPLLDPGPMQAVVLTATTRATHDPAHPEVTCCTVKEVGPVFTVPPGQVTTVPLSLHVAASAAANLGLPGDTSTADGVGISVTEVEASAPIRPTENAADNARIWAPALTAPSTTTATPTVERPGYELDARFTFVEAPGGGSPAAPPNGPGEPEEGVDHGALRGLTLRHGAIRPGKDGRTILLGTARNPPTAKTAQTLRVRTAGPQGPGRKKPPLLGSGRTRIAHGGKGTLKLVLNRAGRAQLAARHVLKATLTIAATDPAGETQMLTRALTVRPAPKPTRSR